MQTPFCSIIVLNYQGKKIIEATLNSVLQLNYPKNKFEIIVVDNGSKDGGKEVIDSFCHCEEQRDEAIPTRSPRFARDDKQNQKLVTNNHQLTTIYLPQNLGFAAGNNAGIKKTKGKYIALLNNDCIVHKDWLKELVMVAEKNEKVFAVNPKVYLGNTNKIQNAGIHIFSNGYGQDRGATPVNKVQQYEEDFGQYNKEEEIDAVCGVASLYRKSVFDQIGLLDESFFLYYEDVEISERAKKFGYKLMYTPKAIAYHQHSASSKELSPLFVYHVEKGRLLHLIYHFPIKVYFSEYIKFSIKSLLHFGYGIKNPEKFFQQFQYLKVTLFFFFLWPYYLGKKRGQLQKIKSKTSSLPLRE